MSENQFKTVYKEAYKMISKLSVESPEAKRLRAQFRHAAAMIPGENPMLWGWLLENLDPELQGKDGDISYAEYAIYITLSMFAIGPRNEDGRTIAEATAIAEIKRNRLVSAETATDMIEMQTALRGLIKLIDSKGYAFNYGKLAEDLLYWQINKTNIARKWEREYARKEK